MIPRPGVRGSWDHPRSAPDPSQPQAVAIEDAARMLSVSPTTIRNMVKRGELPIITIGYRTKRISVAEINRLVGGGNAKEGRR